MPDELTPQDVNADDGAPGDGEEPFDWGSFWGVPQGSEAAVDPADADDDPYEPEVDAAEKDLDKKLAKLEQQTQYVNARLAEMDNSSRLGAAIEAWKAKASPAEQALADILYKSTSLEELRANETLVRQAAAKVEADLTTEREQMRKQMERELQAKYGVPIAPTFQPAPRQDLVNEKLKAGDLDGAASLMLEGFLNP